MMSGNEIEVIGTENVANMIKQSGLPRFVIHKKGAHTGSTPVFECLGTKNSTDASKEFINWSAIILQGNPYNNIAYDLYCFKDADDEEGSKAGEQKRMRAGKVRFTFQLCNPFGSHNQMGQMSGNPFMGHSISPDQIQAQIQAAINGAKLEWENNALRQEIAKLNEEIDDDDDDDDPDERRYRTVDVLLEKLADGSLFKKKKKKVEEEEEEEEEEGVSINGTDSVDEATKKAYVTRLMKALSILKKKDSKILEHLEILANIAVKKPATFAMILEKLDDYK